MGKMAFFAQVSREAGKYGAHMPRGVAPVTVACTGATNLPTAMMLTATSLATSAGGLTGGASQSHAHAAVAL